MYIVTDTGYKPRFSVKGFQCQHPPTKLEAYQAVHYQPQLFYFILSNFKAEKISFFITAALIKVQRKTWLVVSLKFSEFNKDSKISRIRYEKWKVEYYSNIIRNSIASS